MQTAYWKTKERYDRLLKIKKKWDPRGRLWCHQCVGSDGVNYITEGDACPAAFTGSASSFRSQQTAPLGLMLVLVALLGARM